MSGCFINSLITAMAVQAIFLRSLLLANADARDKMMGAKKQGEERNMKFSDIAQGQWPELQPYLDTCLLPVTGLDGIEQPAEATQALEDLRDVMDGIEIPFKGRVVTYPACHYTGEAEGHALVERLCASLKRAGFRYVIIVSARLSNLRIPSADLTIAPDASGHIPDEQQIGQAIRTMWTPAVQA